MATTSAKCLACKVPFVYSTYKQRGKYCSNVCQQAYQTKLLYERIRHEKRKPDGVHEKTVKAFLIKTRGHRCKLCKLTEWRGKPIPLVMDHRDGNSDNWLLTNLRLICCNCDAQTDTYKSRNWGNGRHLRRQRYAEGKSF